MPIFTDPPKETPMDQAEIDALTATVTSCTTDITTEIAALKAANPGLDATALEAAVSGLQGLDTANKPATPATAPEAPAGTMPTTNAPPATADPAQAPSDQPAPTPAV